MNSLLAAITTDEPAPATLRSPPSTLRVRDHLVLVEVEEDLESEIEAEPPTCRYARVA